MKKNLIFFLWLTFLRTFLHPVQMLPGILRHCPRNQICVSLWGRISSAWTPHSRPLLCFIYGKISAHPKIPWMFLRKIYFLTNEKVNLKDSQNSIFEKSQNIQSKDLGLRFLPKQAMVTWISHYFFLVLNFLICKVSRTELISDRKLFFFYQCPIRKRMKHKLPFFFTIITFWFIYLCF